jgi:hypothetical protein
MGLQPMDVALDVVGRRPEISLERRDCIRNARDVWDFKHSRSLRSS